MIRIQEKSCEIPFGQKHIFIKFLGEDKSKLGIIITALDYHQQNKLVSILVLANHRQLNEEIVITACR